MKKIFFAVVTILFCGICVWGIITLNGKDTYYNSSENLTSMNTDKFYKDVLVFKGRVEDSVWIEGRISAKNGESTKTVSTVATIDDLKVSLGSSFNIDDVILETSAKTIKASFNGRLEGITYEGKTLYLELLNYDEFEISGYLSQELLGTIKANDKVVIKFNDNEYSGTISFISNIVNEELQVLYKLDYSDSELVIPFGAGVKVKIVKKYVDDALYIPEYALLKSGNDNYYVLVRDLENVVTKEVTIGIQGDGQVEIISGLEEGQTVLVDISNTTENNLNDTSESE